MQTIQSRNRSPLPLAAVLAVVVLGGLGFLSYHWLAPHRTQVLEIRRPELVLRNGMLYQAGHTQPFSGTMVEFYPSGALKSRSAIVNGLLQGLSEGWHTNQQRAVSEHFRQGVSHGLRTKWYPSGAKMSEVMIVNGKLDGTFRRWHENGILAEEIEMRQGNADGLSRAFYASGFLKAQARLQNGKLIEQKFWKDGELPPDRRAPSNPTRP